MIITRTDRNETFRDGVLVAEDVVQVDVTADVVTLDLHDKARKALADNRTFLALASPTNAQTLAQVKALTRQTQGLIRLALGALDDTD